MEDGEERLSCIARNDGAADRGRKFRNAVASSRARRSRFPVRHALIETALGGAYVTFDGDEDVQSSCLAISAEVGVLRENVRVFSSLGLPVVCVDRS